MVDGGGFGWRRQVVDGGWWWMVLVCLLMRWLLVCCAGVTQACSCAGLTDGLLSKTVTE